VAVRRFDGLPKRSISTGPLRALLGIRHWFVGFCALVVVALIIVHSNGTDSPSEGPASPSSTTGEAVASMEASASSGKGLVAGAGQRRLEPDVQTASETVRAQIKRLVHTVRKDPSTVSNVSDRLALFEKYFDSLVPEDRRALFGCSDFQSLKSAVFAQGDRAPEVLDRYLIQLQLVLF